MLSKLQFQVSTGPGCIDEVPPIVVAIIVVEGVHTRSVCVCGAPTIAAAVVVAVVAIVVVVGSRGPGTVASGMVGFGVVVVVVVVRESGVAPRVALEITWLTCLFRPHFPAPFDIASLSIPLYSTSLSFTVLHFFPHSQTRPDG